MKTNLTRILVSALTLVASIATAADFTVAPTGNDSNPGTQERPWRSFAPVSGRAFAPGDTVRFARGARYSGCLTITASGTPERPIVFTSVGDGAAPRLNNPRFADHSGRIIEITGSHIVVENLYFHDTPAPPPDKPPAEWRESAQHRSVPEMGAVFIAKESAHVIVQNCEFSNCPVGIRVRGQHSIIRRNWLHDAGKITEQWGALAVVVVGPHNDVSYNLIENYGYYGGAFGLDGAAVELDGEDRGNFDAHNTHIHHNVSRNTKGGFLEITGRTRDVTVEYNVSDDIDKFVGVVGVKNLRLANNTIIRTRNPEVAPRTFWTFNNQNDDEISIEGNIFSLGRGQVVYRSAKHPQGFLNTSRRNNLYYSPDGDVSDMIGEPLAPDEMTGDPQFVNAAAGDYTLKPGSPALKSKMGAYPPAADISRVELLDRIYGGWVGMLIGGLEGLPHEFKYKEQPRDTLPEFTFLEKGARSDDDNDFEWPHLFFMDKEGTLKLPYPRLVEIWKANMNSGIWVANKKARELMDQGVVPPETGSVARNPAAWYNLSGQFCVEAYGLIAPGMPQTAADIGLHYTRIAVSEEPLQAAQFWSSLIALRAFHQGPIDDALQQAAAAVDPKSCMAEVVADTRKAFQAYPDDWKAARQQIDAKWRVQRKWNDNSTPVNGAAVCLAVLYGRGDFYRTLQYAMALGYDADCNSATAGAIVGVSLGFQRIAALPQFKMPDRYVNKTRPQLPSECKVSEQAETLLRVAERVILANGGEKITVAGQPGYRVKLQQPRLIEPLPEKVVRPGDKP